MFILAIVMFILAAMCFGGIVTSITGGGTVAVIALTFHGVTSLVLGLCALRDYFDKRYGRREG